MRPSDGRIDWTDKLGYKLQYNNGYKLYKEIVNGCLIDYHFILTCKRVVQIVKNILAKISILQNFQKL